MNRAKKWVTNLSGYVPKILTFHKTSKIGFQPGFWIPQMNSFPIMFDTLGSKVDGLAVRDFRQLGSNSYEI